MKIRYKIIEAERFEDAPFLGVLISAIDCKFNCKNCFNQSIKQLPTLEKEVNEIIKEIKHNPFNKGIIFAGLEWTEQLYEALELAKVAKDNELQTMLYTGRVFEDDIIQTMLQSGLFDYVKCGKYDEKQKTVNHVEYGITLASSNQHIYKKGVDY